jgi:hypothetical protein
VTGARPAIQAHAAAVLAAVLLAGFGWIEIAGGAPAPAQGDDVSIICLNKAGTTYKRKVEPVHCAHFGPGGSFAGGVNLKKLDWRTWGGPRAKGTGRECGFHLPCAAVRAKARAFRIRTACGRRVYTRLKSVSSYGTTVVKLRRCPGQA